MCRHKRYRGKFARGQTLWASVWVTQNFGGGGRQFPHDGVVSDSLETRRSYKSVTR